MQVYFARAKAACLCSYCGNRHLCYDGGGLGRVKKGTPRVGAREKEGKRGCSFLPSFRVSTCAFASKTFARPKKTPALQVMISESSLARQLPAKTSFSPRSSSLRTFRAEETSSATKSEEKRMFSQASTSVRQGSTISTV